MNPFARPRSGRTFIPLIAFLLLFAGLLIGVMYYYFIPAMDAQTHATTRQSRALAAYSRLMLAVVLFVLFGLLILTFRIGRYFLPRPTQPRVKTTYVDAWAESAKRLQVPPREQDE